jgi:hypothetical protein
MTKNLNLLVGDNPFHGISHLSQENARARSLDQNQESIKQAANLVDLSLENGADGFMFSIDETTLAIIRNLKTKQPTNVYAIAPYAFEYVRKSTQTGGVAGLAKSLAKEMIFSSNIKVVAANLFGMARFNLPALLKTYVAYELSRLTSELNDNFKVKSFMIHEIITDMVLALNMEGLCKSYIKFMKNRGIRPGFETRNFPYLVNKFRQWNIDFADLTLTCSFNKVGFQMCPTQQDCEQALEQAQQSEVIAMSILAAGYLKPVDAIDYLGSLPGLSGVVVGVSKERQAVETFRALKTRGKPLLTV